MIAAEQSAGSPSEDIAERQAIHDFHPDRAITIPWALIGFAPQPISFRAWTAPAAPFFRRVLSERAVWDNGPRSQHSSADPLAYYVA